MEKQSFTINYNGKEIPVGALEDNTFIVQISYKPLYIKLTSDNNGQRHTCDMEMNHETMLSKELGELIASNPLFNK